MNKFGGNSFSVTTFGESHGPAIGGIVDGMPPGIPIDTHALQAEMDRRRPGQSHIVTQRREPDTLRILSGIYRGHTTGAPIGFIIENRDQRPHNYDNLLHTWRPSHADMAYTLKYGPWRDHRGGGRASARETAARVAAGALARQALATHRITIAAYTSSVGHITVPLPYTSLDLTATESNPVRCPHTPTARQIENLITQVKNEGDTIGGTVTCVIKNPPPGLGEPLADKLQARLAAAMLSIPAAKGFDYGMGFQGTLHRGSQMLDTPLPFTPGHTPQTLTNHSGGIQGGISTGADIYFRVAFKPVATLPRQIDTVTDTGTPVQLKVTGRHDPCVVPRAVPIVEAMACITLLDAIIQQSHPWQK